MKKRAVVFPGQRSQKVDMLADIAIEYPIIEQTFQEAANNEVLAPANMNATGQVVISAAATAVDRAITMTETLGAQMAIKLPMSVPAQSPLMRSAAEKLQEQLACVVIKSPLMPVIHKVDVEEHQPDDEIRKAIVAQATIKKGSVRIMQTASTDDNSTIHPTIQELKEGDYFGEFCLYGNLAATADVITNTECELIKIEKQSCLQLLNKYPEIGYTFSKKMVEELIEKILHSNKAMRQMILWGLKQDGIDKDL